MHIEYYQCDYCKLPIDYDDKTKYETKEMGYPFIPKDGCGKHFHYDCLEKYYKKKKFTKKEIAELLEDAERRHDKHIKGKIKKGTLTKEKLEQRKATKKDRDSLINYLYDYYGAKVIPKSIQSVIDKVNNGEDFGSFKDTYIPYYQLKDMLVYYKKKLDDQYKKRITKGQFVDTTERIFYDIVFCVNNIEQYAQHNMATYNQVQNISKIDGGEKIFNNAKRLAGSIEEKKKKDKELEEME